MENNVATIQEGAVEEKVISLKEKIVQKLPLCFFIAVGMVSLFFTLKGMVNYFFLMMGQFLPFIPMFKLFGDPTQPNLIIFVVLTVIVIYGWLSSTKFKPFQSPGWRLVWFWNMILGITFQFLWLITAPVYNFIVPYLIQRAELMDTSNIWLTIALGDLDSTLTFFMFIPTVIVVFLIFWVNGQYHQYQTEIKEAFKVFEYKNPSLQKWFRVAEKDPEVISWPDVVLGPESNSQELVVQPGKDRTLNNVIIGSIGTGKTSALLLPIINQDLHWMTRFINDYPKIYQRKDFHTENIKGRYLNGISIIEPSNDLCQKALQLVKAHGIPEESVFYIDPTNKDTPAINPMMGPVEKVAEAFAMVMEGLAEGNTDFFFQQSERNHLKNYIYLLKLHDPNVEATFDMLLQMYDDPNLVHEMHMKLKKTIPPNMEEIEDRDERNHWMIVKQIDKWFDVSIAQKTQGIHGTPVLVQHGKYRGQPLYEDTKAQYVQGLRNVLNDIGASPLIRRVLFGKSSFDFDRHLEAGGVLLVNTAKGELGNLANVLGKFVLLSLQNAVFRRKPNVSTFHHIIIDEFPDYIYRPFKEFPAQSRKYKTIITVVAQTVAQLAEKYGEHYMQTLLGTLRHKMVYGDVTGYDAKLFSEIFGELERFDESVNEQVVSPLQDEPMRRTGNTFSKKKEAILAPSDIIFQEAFQAAVKIVAYNKPLPVKQINANFVPKEEFEKAVIVVDEQAAMVWLDERRKISMEGNSLVHSLEVNASEEFDVPYYEAEEHTEDIMPLQPEAVEDPIEISPPNEEESPKESIPPRPIPADYIFKETRKPSDQDAIKRVVVQSVTTSTDIAETVSFEDLLGTPKTAPAPEKPKYTEIGQKEEEFLKEIRDTVNEGDSEPKQPSSGNALFSFYDE